MTQPKDDLAAVRAVTEALEGFDPKDQERSSGCSTERTSWEQQVPNTI
jgi:hypothetical protein